MREALIKPLAGEHPCGIDAKYSDDYLAVEAEVDKSNSLDPAVNTDWSVVCDACEHLLGETTKDVKLAAWWVYGRFLQGGAAALLEALATLQELFDAFGSDLFPRSGKGKINAMGWLEMVLGDALITPDGVKVPAEDAETFAEVLCGVRDGALKAAESDVSLFRDLLQRFESVAAEVRRRQEEAARKQEAAERTATAGVGSVDGIESDADAVRLLNELKKQALQLSSYWRAEGMADLRALRMTRLIAWLEVEGVPPSEGGRVPLNPPSLERIEQIDALIAEGNHVAALELLETMIARAPFWLEGHHRVFELLETAGHTDAAAEVRHQLAAFVASNPGIASLSFGDGTPFAPTPVKNWLAEVAGAPVAGRSPEAEEGDTLEVIAERCYALIKKKKAKEAMGLLQRSYQQAGVGEAKFETRLLHAEVAVEAGKPEMAMALIDELEREIERHQLDTWRPDLAARVYALLLTSFNRTQVEFERLDRSYKNLCRVDTAGAIEIKLH